MKPEAPALDPNNIGALVCVCPIHGLVCGPERAVSNPPGPVRSTLVLQRASWTLAEVSPATLRTTRANPNATGPGGLWGRPNTAGPGSARAVWSLQPRAARLGPAQRCQQAKVANVDVL